jgi:hypothetical protein
MHSHVFEALDVHFALILIKFRPTATVRALFGGNVKIKLIPGYHIPIILGRPLHASLLWSIKPPFLIEAGIGLPREIPYQEDGESERIGRKIKQQIMQYLWIIYVSLELSCFLSTISFLDTGMKCNFQPTNLNKFWGTFPLHFNGCSSNLMEN